MLDIQSLISNGAAPFLGALGAYLAIREDLAVHRTKLAEHEKDIAEAKKIGDDAHKRIDRIVESK